MKKSLVIFMAITLLASCKESCEVDANFKNVFDISINKVNEYDKFRGTVSDSMKSNFYFSTEYLEKLTQIKANFQWTDVLPYYESRSQCRADIKNWRKWYEENKCRITKEYSDSIKLSVLRGFYGGVPDEELKTRLTPIFYKDVIP